MIQVISISTPFELTTQMYIVRRRKKNKIKNYEIFEEIINETDFNIIRP